ncbi:MAG TPA: hypothetical protein VNJ02_20030 [Vicinamibacterales bacterium]|nr:hypothetical protein [Vicinamibacterales bacterium]
MLEQAQRLLDRIADVRRPADLDLLLFFVRHPRTLMASEQLAAFLGYELKQISESLEVLLGAGLLTRSQHPAHAARLFMFTSTEELTWLPPFLEFTSSQEGRGVLRRELKRRVSETMTLTSAVDRYGREPRSRPTLVREQSASSRDAKTAARRGGQR